MSICEIGNVGQSIRPYPTAEQIAELTQKSDLVEPQLVRLNSKNQIAITIPPDGVALLELV